MEIIPTTIGSYPRPDWFREYLRKSDGLQKGGKKEIEDEGGKYRKALTEVIAEQRNAGIKLLTDGQLLWGDFLCHLCTRIEGFRMGGLIRYFDNNTYYRKPSATAKLGRRTDIVTGEFTMAHEIEPEIKPVLSCFTLAELSENEFYSDKKEFVLDIADIMNLEAKNLARAGARYIQIDEPCLLHAGKDDLDMAKEAIEIIQKGVNAKFFLTTYFGDVEKIFPEILDFPVDVLGMDFIENHGKNLEIMGDYRITKEIQAGVVDGRTTAMEKKEDVKNMIDNLVEATGGKVSYVSPNTGLEFLPYSKASEKLRILCDAVG